jgi:hypothetical protein
MVKLYKVVVLAALALYAAVAFSGWELESAAQKPQPPSVRTSPGGYRSFHFWHTGFHGGK